MKEPNIDMVIQMLMDGDYQQGVFEMRNANEMIAWLLYFLQKEQVPTFFEKIDNLEKENRDEVFGALVSLYPLSRDIIFKMLKNEDARPADFVTNYDWGNEMIKSLKKVVEEVRRNSVKVNRKANEYIDELKKLEQQIQDEKEELEKCRNLGEEVEKKYQELEYLKEQIKNNLDEKKLDEEIQDMKNELENKKEMIEKKQQEQKKVKGELEKIIKEANGKKDTSKSVQEAFSALEQYVKKL